jgi:tryptophan synthase alpha chain
MSRISDVFKGGHKALLSYITAGYPDIKTTLKTAQLLAESGSDIIELGIPFSDPLADGATIQKASYLSLRNGTTPEICLETAEKIRHQIKTPLVFMTYYNPILNYGLGKFCTDCRDAGINGLIVPDLPPEEGTELENTTRRHDLDMIYLLAPTSTEERIAEVGKRSRGFIYLVSLTGVTGVREQLPTGLESFVRRARRKTRKSLCVGFGISSAAQAKRVAAIADGVIVGSRLIQLIDEDASLGQLKVFITGLRRAVDSA